MSLLADQTEKNALYEIAKCFKFLKNLDSMKVSAEDAFRVRLAENSLLCVVESNGYQIITNPDKTTTLKRLN